MPSSFDLAQFQSSQMMFWSWCEDFKQTMHDEISSLSSSSAHNVWLSVYLMITLTNHVPVLWYDDDLLVVAEIGDAVL